MRSMWWQLGVLGTILAFAFRHRETKKNLCRGGRSQDLKVAGRRTLWWRRRKKSKTKNTNMIRGGLEHKVATRE